MTRNINLLCVLKYTDIAYTITNGMLYKRCGMLQTVLGTDWKMPRKDRQAIYLQMEEMSVETKDGYDF